MRSKIFWKKPRNKDEYENSLTDILVAAPAGAEIVYYHGQSGLCDSKITGLAARVAGRFGFPLVQKPESPAASSRRSWFYMIQKPTGDGRVGR